MYNMPWWKDIAWFQNIALLWWLAGNIADAEKFSHMYWVSGVGFVSDSVSPVHAKWLQSLLFLWTAAYELVKRLMEPAAYGPAAEQKKKAADGPYSWPQGRCRKKKIETQSQHRQLVWFSAFRILLAWIRADSTALHFFFLLSSCLISTWLTYR